MDEKASCEGKQKHTRTMAKKIVRRSKEKSLDAYKCRYCNHWHIGRRKM